MRPTHSLSVMYCLVVAVVFACYGLWHNLESPLHDTVHRSYHH